MHAVRMATVLAAWAAHTQRAAVLRHRAAALTRHLDIRRLAAAMVGWAGVTKDSHALCAKLSKMVLARSDKLQVRMRVAQLGGPRAW